MKTKLFALLLLTALLLLISLAACAQRSEAPSSSASDLSSALEQEAQSLPEDSSGSKGSSREYKVVFPSQPVDGWNSPTGLIPYTYEELFHNYEEHPDLGDYYYDYLVPLNFLLGDTWGKGQDAPTHSVVQWLWFSFSDEEREPYVRMIDIHSNGVEYPFVDRELVEQAAWRSFGLSAEALRDDECYYEEFEGYLFMAGGLGLQPAYVIDQVEKEGAQAIITYRRVTNLNYPSKTLPPEMREETYRLTMELKEEGRVWYPSCEEIK